MAQERAKKKREMRLLSIVLLYFVHAARAAERNVTCPSIPRSDGLCFVNFPWVNEDSVYTCPPVSFFPSIIEALTETNAQRVSQNAPYFTLVTMERRSLDQKLIQLTDMRCDAATGLWQHDQMPDLNAVRA